MEMSRRPLSSMDPVDLALSPYLRGTYYDQASQRVMPTSSLLYPASRAAIAAASRRRRPRPRPVTTNKRARIPASSEAILGLREVTAMDAAAADCAICLKALLEDPADQDQEPADDSEEMTTSRLRAMPCSHVFHQHCIFQWLHRNAVCPLCRHQMPTTDDDDDDDDEDQVSPDFWFQSVPQNDEGTWEEEDQVSPDFWIQGSVPDNVGSWEEEEEEPRRRRRR